MVVMVVIGSNSYFEVMTFEVIGSNDVVIKNELTGRQGQLVVVPFTC
jgi:hypothetical protein